MKLSSSEHTLKEIKHELLGAYLLATGWLNDGCLSESACVWHRPEEHHFDLEIIQPTNSKMLGYSQRLHEAIKGVSEYENRLFGGVLDDIVNFNSDVIKVRVISADVEGGSIPISDGVLLFERAKDLLVSSTLSTFSKKKFFSGGRSNVVQEFLNTLKFVQTEHGSYIVNIIAPISPCTENEFSETKSSITRSVSNNLANSLKAINTAINEYEKSEDLFVFEKVVPNGVSANLCDALIGISGTKKNRDIEVSIDLATSEPDIQERLKTHKFNSETMSILKVASEYYKGSFVIKDYNVKGLVVRLDHSPSDDGGNIRVNCLVNDVWKKVSIQLTLKEYWEAVKAHEKNNYVCLVGDLHVRPRSIVLIDYRDFRVLEKDDLFD